MHYEEGKKLSSVEFFSYFLKNKHQKLTFIIEARVPNARVKKEI